MDISEVCSRCGRQQKLESNADVLVAKLNAQRDMKACVQAINEFITALETPLPAAIIITADKTVRVLEHLCSEPVGKFHGCTQRVADMIANILGKSIPRLVVEPKEKE